MEIANILTADVLDIIFEGRNKEYGAYELRRSYSKRLLVSIAVMLSLILLLLAGYVWAGKTDNTLQAKEFVIPDNELTKIKEPEKEPEPLPPPKQPDPPKMEMAKFTPPKIVKDNEVKEDEKPPEMEKLEDTKIGNINQDGLKDDGIVAPPADDAGKGIIEAPKKEEEDWTKTFVSVQIESQYPGGHPAWERFLKRNFHYPQEAMDNEVQGTVVVQFIVDLEGNVSNVEAISGPEELRPEAVRVIKKSGKWTPAIQNGRQVKSYKKQPVTFRLGDE
jgi:periplasmic protein TonB